MKTNIQLTGEIVKALNKFFNSEKNLSDRIALRASLMAEVAECKEVKYEGETYKLTDELKKDLCETTIPDIIPLDGELETHPFSIYGSGSIGYTIILIATIQQDFILIKGNESANHQFNKK